jgi:hypothetical protein
LDLVAADHTRWVGEILRQPQVSATGHRLARPFYAYWMRAGDMTEAGEVGIDPKLILTASEIATFAFCPAAWHLQRMGAARDSTSNVNLEHGRRAHRQIARHAMRVGTLERARKLLLLVIVAVLVVAGLAQVWQPATGAPLQP